MQYRYWYWYRNPTTVADMAIALVPNKYAYPQESKLQQFVSFHVHGMTADDASREVPVTRIVTSQQSAIMQLILNFYILL